MGRDWLIKGGRVLPMVEGIGEIRADILVRDGRIEAVERDIQADVPVIDAADGIVIPGFVDTHRHVWQAQLRTVATDWSLRDYAAHMRQGYSAFYTAEDAYLGNYVGLLEALDAGVTTVVDHCHIINSPEHAHEALRGFHDAGTRGIFCYGTFDNEARVGAPVPKDPAWRRATARALRRERLERGIVKFGFAPAEAEAMDYGELVSEIDLARDLGAAAISLHARMGAYDFGIALVEQLQRDGRMGADLLFVHGASFSDKELALIAEAGAAISSTPETELQMGMGFPVAHRASGHGVKVSLGVDIVSNFSGDMFMPMRLALQSTRAARNEAMRLAGDVPLEIEPKAETVLRMATIGGAEAIGMAHEIGSLEVGKRADIAIVDTLAIHMTPSSDPVGALVLNARPSDVRWVLVDGELRKREGALVGVDWMRLRDRFASSAERIRAGYAGLDRSNRVEREFVTRLEGGA